MQINYTNKKIDGFNSQKPPTAPRIKTFLIPESSLTRYLVSPYINFPKFNSWFILTAP